MNAINENTLEHIREFLSRGCEYSGTQEIINETCHSILTEHTKYPYSDDVFLVDLDDNTVMQLDEFVDKFWDAAVEMIMNVLATEETEEDYLSLEWNSEWDD